MQFTRYMVLIIKQIVKWKETLMKPSDIRNYILMGRFVYTQLRSISWFFHCKEAELFIKISLVLLFTLNLEDERACVVRMVYEELGAGKVALETLPIHAIDLLAEFSVMKEPYWEVEDVEAFLNELERRGDNQHQLVEDLRSFIRGAPEVSRVKQGEREEAMRRLEAGEPLGELAPTVSFTDVPRVHARDLTFKRFFEEFAMLRRPVIIEGLDFGLEPESAWDEIRELCGEVLLDKLQRTSDCCDWSSLEYFTSGMTLGEWMDEVRAGRSHDGRVLFDFSLMDADAREQCPKLMQRLIIPRYFTTDFSKRAPWFPEEWASQDPFSGHPAIFVQPEETNIFWHSDHLNANFWQLLLAGRKRWRLAPLADQRDRMIWLCEHPTLRFAVAPEGDQPIEPVPYSGIFPKDPDQHCPLWKRAVEKELFRIVDVETVPGDTIYIPSGIVHQTTQLEASLALSMNYVDDSNVNSFFEAADDAESGYERDHFGAQTAPLLLEPRDLPWRDYIRGPRPWESLVGRSERLLLERAVCEAAPLREAKAGMHGEGRGSSGKAEDDPDDTDDFE